MGFLTTIWTMSGYDAPFHLSEECSNANIAGMVMLQAPCILSLILILGPRAIVSTAVSGLIGGWAIILVIVYTVTNIPVCVTSPSKLMIGY